MAASRPLQAISLFSGCGGDTLGLEAAGFHVIAFSEFNKAATQTHLANFPGSVLLEESKSKSTDITKIPDTVFEPYRRDIGIFVSLVVVSRKLPIIMTANETRNAPRIPIERNFASWWNFFY